MQAAEVCRGSIRTGRAFFDRDARLYLPVTVLADDVENRQFIGIAAFANRIARAVRRLEANNPTHFAYARTVAHAGPDTLDERRK